ncbi:hypothetical protein QR680_009601 [Steinernema hermaphroditum]|uniref:Uncharacterized protein n=1 Tax=Steinernema hermaphroditum TaxID=289476 RepID=A0AA39IMZ0_9BILA|nr:hypothetical protein QR680_009601 [Steinernema hermaphroditum]
MPRAKASTKKRRELGRLGAEKKKELELLAMKEELTNAKLEIKRLQSSLSSIESETVELRRLLAIAESRSDKYETEAFESQERTRKKENELKHVSAFWKAQVTGREMSKKTETSKINLPPPTPPLKSSWFCSKSKAAFGDVKRYCDAFCKMNKGLGVTGLQLASQMLGIRTKTLSEFYRFNKSTNVAVEGQENRRLPGCRPRLSLSNKERSEGMVEESDPLVVHLLEQEIDKRYRIGKPVVVNDILDALKSIEAVSDCIPQSISSLRRLIIGLGYRYKKVNGRYNLTETGDVIHKRLRYLERIQKLRNEHCVLVYCDETWCFEGMTHHHDWTPTSPLAELQMKGLCFGPSAPTTRGKRAIVLHAITEEGPRMMLTIIDP